MADVKRRIHASLFEIRLFSDDLVAIARAQLDMLRHNATYIRLSLVPLVWMIVPLVLLIAQLQFHYAYGGLEVGRATIVTVRLTEGAPLGGDGGAAGADPVRLDASNGLRVETPAVWIPSLREASWRVSASEPGDHTLTVTVGGRSATKTVRASDRVGRRSPVRLEAGFVNQLIYPAEAPIDEGVAIESIAVVYPDAGVWFFGWTTHWMVVFFVLSIVFAFALRKPFKVVI
jgi:hypothetical protein